MKWSTIVTLIGVLAIAADVGAQIPAAPPIQFIEPNADTGSSQATVVGPVNLLHTGQLFSVDKQGAIIGTTATDQANGALDQLAALLNGSASSLEQVAKLNFYTVSDEAANEVGQVLAKRFAGAAKPAVSYVVGKLTHPDALVALDVVAATQLKVEPGHALRERLANIAPPPGGLAGPHLALLPVGPKVYVSGDAKPGDMSQATAATLANLEATLRQLGLNRDSIVQLKCFLQPITAAPLVEAEIVRFFNGIPVPVVYVEWTMAGPIEIELIATAPAGTQAATMMRGHPLAFFTPAGVTPSPVFSRVACINSEQTIYISGLYSAHTGDGAHQVRDIFMQLQKVLGHTHSDLRHLVKATYYVANDDVSKQLNTLRPEYYDPARPPAASKASVQAVGVPDRSITLDMIAVPTPVAK